MPKDDSRDLIEVKIGALIMDPNTNTPIVVLKGVGSEAVLPIWVGAFEANAIALEIEKIVPQRPMTHDLLRNVIIEFGLSAVRVVVTDLKDNTFYASIELSDENGELVTLDARPSDAIALALRLDCPIYVERHVLELSAASTQQQQDQDVGDPGGVDEWPELIG
ncbi:bifunctional nuclease family protein [Leptolyngbya sp. 7M]|uniref:bifunctional nuclease family protein n=1 Tax=Leptolyngbya sp. 7M TaxID=2812896 RepID=UPI001B8D74E0|nr:bifunctional nuclease family protein [Leptolyngbya sp. 7M]QYO67115.1 bifunctional nuclease family protein [Leptolyngbya sp. 7M]